MWHSCRIASHHDSKTKESKEQLSNFPAVGWSSEPWNKIRLSMVEADEARGRTRLINSNFCFPYMKNVGVRNHLVCFQWEIFYNSVSSRWSKIMFSIPSVYEIQHRRRICVMVARAMDHSPESKSVWVCSKFVCFFPTLKMGWFWYHVVSRSWCQNSFRSWDANVCHSADRKMGWGRWWICNMFCIFDWDIYIYSYWYNIESWKQRSTAIQSKHPLDQSTWTSGHKAETDRKHPQFHGEVALSGSLYTVGLHKHPRRKRPLETSWFVVWFV